MEINIYEDGQVIHLETCSNDCNVATVCNGNVIENKVSGNALNTYITAFLDSVVNRWMYNFMEGNIMTRTDFEIIRGLMVKDNALDSWIFEREATEKRDLTVEEENAYIQETVDQCHQIMQDLSCNLVEAYKELME